MKQRRLKQIAVVAILAVGVAGAAFLSQNGAFAKGSANPVVAVVNGTEIHKQEITDVVKTLSPQVAANAKELYPMIVDQLINEKLLEKEVSKSDLMSDPEVLKRMDMAKEQIVRAFYLERRVSEFVTDKTVKAEYSKFKEENKGQKEVRARHILVKTEEEAKAAIKELDGGADFAKLAKEKSVGPTSKRGGDLGYFTKESMVPEFSEIAFKTKKGTYAKAPVKSQFGWHVIFVEDSRDKKVPAFAEVEDGIKAKLGQLALEGLIQDLRKTATIERFDINGKPLN